MAPLKIDSFFKPTSETSNSKNAKKRVHDRPFFDLSTASKKSKPTTKSGPKLKKPLTPAWQAEHLSQNPPTAPNAKKCVEKWSLLAPYDTRITEEQWAKYYDERSALEVMNTCGSEKWKKIESEELMQKTSKLLEEAGGRLAEVILASAGIEEEKKTKIAETLKSSLYYLELWGNEEDGMDDDDDRTVFSPRSVESVSCRDISDCNGLNSKKCAAELQQNPNKPAKSGTKLFNWTGQKTSGIPATNLAQYEESLFAWNEWISPYLMYQLLCAGGTVTIYQEPMQGHVRTVQEKFKKFAGENLTLRFG